MSEHDPLLERAATTLRKETEPGWSTTAGKIIRALRASLTRAWPLQAAPPQPESTSDIIYVTDHVLRVMILRRLHDHLPCRPTRIDLHSDHTRLRSITVDVVAPYDIDLHELSESIREHTHLEVLGVLGPEGTGNITIDINFCDIDSN